jgi:predicted ATPase
LVQVIRFLSDRALISVVDGVAQTASVEALEALVPPTWAQVTLARLDGLSEIERRVLRTASAIGVSFSTRVIEGVEPEIPVHTIHGAVDNLEKRELVLADLTSDEYRFHDEMMRTIAYSIIPEEDRRRVHQRIANVLQQWTSREDLGAVIAHHLEKAGDFTEALAWFSKMVIRTAQRGLLQESKYFEQRLDRLRKMLS